VNGIKVNAGTDGSLIQHYSDQIFRRKYGGSDYSSNYRQVTHQMMKLI